MHTNILRVDVEVMGPASAAQQQNKGQQTQTEIQEVHLIVRKSSFTLGVTELL